MKLDPHQNIKVESKIQAEKKQEFKQIGRTIKKPGQHLFAYNTETSKVYKVEIQQVKTVDFTKTDCSPSRAIVNPNHPMLWAINLKNAERKFGKNIQ